MNCLCVNLRFGSLRDKIIVSIIVMIFAPGMNPCYSQTSVYLQHRLKPDRQKHISAKRPYIIQTTDTIFYRHRLVAYSEDTVMLYAEKTEDLIKIAINEIDFIEKSKKYGFFEVFATLGIISLSITPVIWATEGNEAALEMLEVSGVFLAGSVPFLLLKEVGRKKDTKNKWLIKVS